MTELNRFESHRALKDVTSFQQLTLAGAIFLYQNTENSKQASFNIRFFLETFLNQRTQWTTMK